MGKFPGCRLFQALNRLTLLDCHVKFQDDWRHPNCFTVDFEMQSRGPRGAIPALKPFRYFDTDGTEVATEGTHTHTGFPDCTEEQGYNQLCQSLENAAETIENHAKGVASS